MSSRRVCANNVQTTKKAAPKAAKPKAVPAKPKSKPASKKKVLTDRDDNAEDSAMDVDLTKDASDDDEPSKPSGSGLQAERKKKTASETYQKVCYFYMLQFCIDVAFSCHNSNIFSNDRIPTSAVSNQ